MFIKSLSFGITFNYQTLTKKFEKFGAESLRVLARVVLKVDNAIHRINHYLMDSVVCFVNTYPLDSDLSSGKRYPAFEQLGPERNFLLYQNNIK